MAGLDDADVFSMGFSERKKYVTVGQGAVFSLWLESYASLVVDLSVESGSGAGGAGIEVTPSSAQVVTGADNGFHELNLTVSPVQQSGTYAFTVEAAVRDCGPGRLCTKRAAAELVASQELPDLTGFTASLFPENINVRDLQPVTYRLAITNMGESDEFTVEASLPEGLETTFAPTTITVPEGGYRTITFAATPGSVSSSYELEFTVSSGRGIEKPVTAYLSTNELLTDAARSMEQVNQVGDAERRNQATDELDRWYRTYQDSGYGENLDEYSELQGKLQAARQPSAAHVPSENQTPQQPQQGFPQDTQDLYQGMADEKGLDLLGKDLWILLVIMLVVLGAVFLILKKMKRKSSGLDEEMELA